MIASKTVQILLREDHHSVERRSKRLCHRTNFRDEGRNTTHATICRVVYAILLLLLKTYIPAPIPAVSFSLLVSSFVEGSIQADLLLLCDSVANFLDNFASNSELCKPKDVLHLQSLSFSTIVSSFKPTTILFAFLGILALSLCTITHAAIYIIIRDIVLMCVYFLHAHVLWCSLPACVSHSCLWFRTFNHHNTPCTQTHLGTQDTQLLGVHILVACDVL